MNIAVDYGNTIAKVGIFKDHLLLDRHFFLDATALRSFLENHPAEHIIVSSVSFPAGEVLSWSDVAGQKIVLSPALPLPIKNLYKTPETLGVDRLAAVSGAFDIFPNQNCLVIDAGTCITYEFLDDHGNYHGGGISPGVKMRFEAMHAFTTKLPLVQPVNQPALVGNSTEACLQSGVINGAIAEIQGIIQQYMDLFPKTQIVLCGGDAPFFEKQINHPLIVAPDLVLTGLNRILRHIIRL
jgi:type III pantothenate kinase